MHRHKKFRYGPPLFRPHRRRHFGGMIWLIVLAFLFLNGGGRFWPAILVLIGLAVIFGSLFRDKRPDEPPSPPPFDPPPFAPAPPPPLRPAPPPAAEAAHRTELLPTNCPNCGGPVRSGDVKWTGAQSASCAYCGSNLPMKK